MPDPSSAIAIDRTAPNRKGAPPGAFPNDQRPRQEEGARRHPESSTLQVVAGRLLEEEGRFDEALPHFRAVRLDDGGGSAVMTAARYCYLWDAFDDAAALYAYIFSAYFALRIADDHFLCTRRLPFFGVSIMFVAGGCFLSGVCSGSG